MSASTSCLFCKIIQGDVPSVRVYEDAHTIAFMDIQPMSVGHTLVIPKTHAPNLLEMPVADLHAVVESAQRIARAVQQALTPDGLRISQLNGAAAGQTVFHYHVHIIPVWEGTKLCGHARTLADPEALKIVAAKIRAALAAH